MLGIAWVASPDAQSAGGVCERHTWFTVESLPSGAYSLNTLVVTQLNRGERLPDAITALSVTHELGHSFGASHDDDWTGRPDCSGDYIMAARATRLDHPNNWRFSPCSRRSMSAIIASGYATKPASSTQPCFPPWPLNRALALIGWYQGRLTSPHCGWEIDPPPTSDTVKHYIFHFSCNYLTIQAQQLSLIHI